MRRGMRCHSPAHGAVYSRQSAPDPSPPSAHIPQAMEGSMRMLLLRAATASALLVVPLALHAQTREITGRVMSRDTQEPLNNVEIVVVGQSARLGTYTNDQGRYRIVLNTGDATLRLRRLGYRARTVPAPATESTIDIQL